MALISRCLFFRGANFRHEEIRFISRSLARNLSRNYVCVNSGAKSVVDIRMLLDLSSSFNDRLWNVDDDYRAILFKVDCTCTISFYFPSFVSFTIEIEDCDEFSITQLYFNTSKRKKRKRENINYTSIHKINFIDFKDFSKFNFLKKRREKHPKQENRFTSRSTSLSSRGEYSINVITIFQFSTSLFNRANVLFTMINAHL